MEICRLSSWFATMSSNKPTKIFHKTHWINKLIQVKFIGIHTNEKNIQIHVFGDWGLIRISSEIFYQDLVFRIQTRHNSILIPDVDKSSQLFFSFKDGDVLYCTCDFRFLTSNDTFRIQFFLSCSLWESSSKMSRQIICSKTICNYHYFVLMFIWLIAPLQNGWAHHWLDIANIRFVPLPPSVHKYNWTVCAFAFRFHFSIFIFATNLLACVT